MPNIFDYNDFRKFLADYYEEQKGENPSFSYMNFSRKAGFTSKSFVFNAIRGTKNLSKSSIVGLCEAMGLNKTECIYFENLVSFNQSKSFKEKNHFFGQLDGLRPKKKEETKAKRLRHDQFEFYSKWYHLAVRSLIDMHGYRDYRKLAKMVHPQITPKQAQKSVLLLDRLGLIKKQKDGNYSVTDKILSTGEEIVSLAIQHFHLDTIQLASNAIRELPLEKRNISGLTLGISRKAYKQICDMIYSCQNEILNIVEKDESSDGVYQLNFHLFPLSKPK